MARNTEEMLQKRPVDRAVVAVHKTRILKEVFAFRLRELRGASDLTQVQLAGRLQITQSRLSRIEHGDIARAQVDTLRKYVEVIGGTLRVEVGLGDERIQIA
ncbi:helix-turn-helix domain-containing protein [Paeniglutamicibacter sp. ORCA_105]|uniref:helix-turn-helix domain-containing protein n=1 Tax=Paeniglutamicibacter sp. ORCA_105 TaxID=3377336 RepID=UPI0038956163